MLVLTVLMCRVIKNKKKFFRFFNLTVTALTAVFLKFTEAKHYHSKLVNIRNDMMMLHEKTSKLKVS